MNAQRATNRTAKAKAKATPKLKPLTADEFRELMYGGKPIPDPTWTESARQIQAVTTDLMSMSPQEIIRYFDDLIRRTGKEITPPIASNIQRKAASLRIPQPEDWLTLASCECKDKSHRRDIPCRGTHRLRICPPSSEAGGLPYFKVERNNQTRYLWNVVNRHDGKVYVLGTTERFFKTLEDQARFCPMADAERGNDFLFTATRQGDKQLWGSAPLIITHPCPLGYEGELFNLATAATQ